MSMAVSVASIIIAMMLGVVLTILWHIHLVVPAILYKIDRVPAGVVLATMLAPVLRVPWRDAQVDGRMHNTHGHGLDYDRLRVDHLRLREGADVNAPVEARLADLHRHTDIGGNRGSRPNCDHQG
jgi:hypothetical protein